MPAADDPRSPAAPQTALLHARRKRARPRGPTSRSPIVEQQASRAAIRHHDRLACASGRLTRAASRPARQPPCGTPPAEHRRRQPAVLRGHYAARSAATETLSWGARPDTGCCFSSESVVERLARLQGRRAYSHAGKPRAGSRRHALLDQSPAGRARPGVSAYQRGDAKSRHAALAGHGHPQLFWPYRLLGR